MSWKSEMDNYKHDPELILGWSSRCITTLFTATRNSTHNKFGEDEVVLNIASKFENKAGVTEFSHLFRKPFRK